MDPTRNQSNDQNLNVDPTAKVDSAGQGIPNDQTDQDDSPVQATAGLSSVDKTNDLDLFLEEARNSQSDLQVNLTINIPASIAIAYGSGALALAEALSKQAISLSESASPGASYVKSDDRSFFPQGDHNFTIAWNWNKN